MNSTLRQLEAITTTDPDVIVVAGPGSGKTATTVARIDRLIKQGISPGKMLCLTFTNVAANELIKRLPTQSRSDDPEKKEVPMDFGFIGTLHSFALRMLKELGAPFGYGDRVAVLSPESAEDLIESIAKTLGCKLAMKDLLKLKAAGRPPRPVDGKMARLSLPQTVIATYFDQIKEAGIVDYDVLLTEFRDMLLIPGVSAVLAARFDHFFVDEVQDSSTIQWHIYRLLPIANKFHVGDGDQSIFAFAGGSVGEMLFHADRPSTTMILLEENFRSRQRLCDAANLLIAHNTARIPKIMKSAVGPGGTIIALPPLANQGAEIAVVGQIIQEINGREDSRIQGATIAILTYTNAVAANFRRALSSCGIPVVERKSSELPRDWKHARAFIELLVEPNNDALAFFYLIGLYEKKGVNPKEAREAAHAVRRAAAGAGKSINAANMGFGRVSEPRIALQALAAQSVSKEAQAIAADKFRELPPGATMLDLALALGEIREYQKEEEGPGVNVLTIHGAKGREFDVVFVVGFEDEVMPGRAAKIMDPDERLAAIEESRRLAYVAITRARHTLYLTSAQSRDVIYGNVPQTVKRTPSRFIAEIMALTPATTKEGA